MIQVGTVLKITDNSGGLLARCIHVSKGSKRNCAKIGDLIIISIVSALPDSKLPKGSVHPAVIVRTKNINRSDGNQGFSNNAVALLSKQNEVIGTRILGPVSKELKRNPDFLKIVSLAAEVI